jgi:hypothetical protein
VWITPELFNFALGVLAYFCWLFKEVAPARAPRGMGWLLTGRSDIVAAGVLGIATFSKPPPFILLFAPLALWLVWQRRWWRFASVSSVFVIVAAGLFAANMAISGEWNYQGGERKTFSYEFPFQTASSDFNIVPTTHGRDEALTDVIFGSVFWTNFTHNLGWAFIGRHAGLVPYYFPAVFALAWCLAGIRRRPAWQLFVLAAAVGQIVFFIITLPYTWNGGGGSVGNRYFMGAYGVFLFLLPPAGSALTALVPWLAGALFTAPLVLNPFVTSFRPGDHTKSGPFRLLPVELTLVYDWPINTQLDRVRIWFGDNPRGSSPGFQIYFFDDNAFVEGDGSFWTKGEARAEFLVKTDRPMKRLHLELTAGPERVEVEARLSGRSQTVSLAPGESQKMTFVLGDGFPYQGTWPVWTASIAARSGFVPIFYGDAKDTRFLGVRVKPTLVE